MGTSGSTSNQGPLSGQRLGDKYLLGALLGQGGFGVVYQAQHILLNRPQAIKILLEQHFTNPKFRERFLREARTLAALDHPNIVHVDDFGLEGTRAYLVMAYVGGGTLQGRLKARRGSLGLNEVWRYLEQICAALDYAHARSVAHLDLKPLNLLLHEDGRLLLTDFGLAHLMEQGAVEGGTSLAFGTPSYMSPEHFDGQPGQQSDVYALGVILYQMLTGRLPFEGSTPRAILLKVLADAPPPLGSVRPDLPPGLEGVVNKALAKQIAGRYQTAGELLADFKAAMAGRQTQALSSGASIVNAPTRLTPPPPPQNSTIWTASPPGAPPDTTIRAYNPPGAPVPLPPTIRAVNPPIEPGELSMQLPPAITPDKSPAPEATPVRPSPKPALVPRRRLSRRALLLAGGLAGVALAGGGGFWLWRVLVPPRGTRLLTYRGHSGDVYAVAWSPDGSRIASGSRDDTVQVWEAGTGTALLTYRGHSDWVWAVAWSPDGSRIASGSYDDTVQVWPGE